MKKRNSRDIYALAVCFICAVAFSIAAAGAVYSLVKITAPSFTLSAWTHGSLQSNLSFVRDSWPEDRPVPDDAALTELRLQHYDIAISGEVRSGLQSLLDYLIAMAIAGLLFGFHWRMAKPLSPLPPPRRG